MTDTEKAQLHELLTAAHRDHSKELKMHAFFKVRDATLCEDLVQDTFMKTWKYLQRGGQIHMMKAFLYHILNHLIVDEYRKHKTTSLDVLLEKGFEPSAGDTEKLSVALDAKASLLLIRQLPEKYQRVMHLRYVQNLSLREISQITGQSKNTVAVQAHRGLKKLRSIYASASKSMAVIGGCIVMQTQRFAM